MITFITTPIFYINSDPHIGHHYSLALAASMRYYYYISGSYSNLVSGTDEHGEKVYESYLKSQQEGNKEDLYEYILMQREMFSKELLQRYVAVEYATETDYHKLLVKYNITKLLKENKIYAGIYTGYYDLKEEKYIDQEYINKIDEEYKKKYIRNKTEKGYYYNLQNNKDRILSELKNIVDPEYYNLALNLVKDAKDVFITREYKVNSLKYSFDPSEELGIYVWFEALQYYTYFIKRNINNANFELVIGKDIIYFHTAILASLCIDLYGCIPYRLKVHPLIVTNDKKISKSDKNIETTKDLILNNYRFTVSYLLTKGLDKDFEVTTESVETHKNLIYNNVANLIKRYFVLYSQYHNYIHKSDYYKIYESDEIQDLYRAIDSIDKYDPNIFKTMCEFAHKANKMFNDMVAWEVKPEKVREFIIVGEYVMKIIAIYPMFDLDNRAREIFGIFYRKLFGVLKERYVLINLDIENSKQMENRDKLNLV